MGIAIMGDFGDGSPCCGLGAPRDLREAGAAGSGVGVLDLQTEVHSKALSEAESTSRTPALSKAAPPTGGVSSSAPCPELE